MSHTPWGPADDAMVRGTGTARHMTAASNRAMEWARCRSERCLNTAGSCKVTDDSLGIVRPAAPGVSSRGCPQEDARVPPLSKRAWHVVSSAKDDHVKDIADSVMGVGG